MSQTVLSSIVVCIAVALGLADIAHAQEDKRLENPDIIVRVDGLACPFCAYGIEKRLEKVDGIKRMAVLLEDGLVEIEVESGRTVGEEELRKAVRKAGFEAREIIFARDDGEKQEDIE